VDAEQDISKRLLGDGPPVEVPTELVMGIWRRVRGHSGRLLESMADARCCEAAEARD
jgi:hypothetical protein